MSNLFHKSETLLSENVSLVILNMKTVFLYLLDSANLRTFKYSRASGGQFQEFRPYWVKISSRKHMVTAEAHPDVLFM